MHWSVRKVLGCFFFGWGGGEGSCSFERGGTLPEKRQTQKHPVNVKMFFFPLENYHNYSTHNQMLNV